MVNQGYAETVLLSCCSIQLVRYFGWRWVVGPWEWAMIRFRLHRARRWFDIAACYSATSGTRPPLGSFYDSCKRDARRPYHRLPFRSISCGSRRLGFHLPEDCRRCARSSLLSKIISRNQLTVGSIEFYVLQRSFKSKTMNFGHWSSGFRHRSA